VCWDRWKDHVTDEAGVVAKHGVSPESMPDLLALVGDTADGIPGIAGWGKSSAAKILTVWKHIEAIPDDPNHWKVTLRGSDRLAASLRDARDTLRLYRTLAVLRVDCPIPRTVEELEWRGADREQLDAFCKEIEVDPSMIKLDP
jgi:5'-3' exonuclease